MNTARVKSLVFDIDRKNLTLEEFDRLIAEIEDLKDIQQKYEDTVKFEMEETP